MTTTETTTHRTPDPEPTPIGEVLRAAAQGDATAWGEVIRRYTPVVRARMRPYRLQDADRADVAQTVWLRLAENLGRIHTPEHLGGWLATVVARECQLVHRVAARTVLAGELIDATGAESAPGPEDVVLGDELARRLWGAVAELPAARRDLVRALFDQESRSYAEISRTTGIPIGGIGPNRGRAVRQLRAAFGDRPDAW